MNLTPQPSTEIALNVTRTRVTVLMFNLTIIAFMMTLLGSRSAAANSVARALWWLHFAHNDDAEGWRPLLLSGSPTCECSQLWFTAVVISWYQAGKRREK